MAADVLVAVDVAVRQTGGGCASARRLPRSVPHPRTRIAIGISPRNGDRRRGCRRAAACRWVRGARGGGRRRCRGHPTRAAASCRLGHRRCPHGRGRRREAIRAATRSRAAAGTASALGVEGFGAVGGLLAMALRGFGRGGKPTATHFEQVASVDGKMALGWR